MKIYHTETQEDYDALMVELERLGIETLEKRLWKENNNQTVVLVRAIGRYIDNRTDTTFGGLARALKNYPRVPIIKYKAKADEKMRFTKENIEKVIDDYFWQADFEPCGDLIAEIHNLDDTPEKVVVPKFVAEFYEKRKYCILSLIFDEFKKSEERKVADWYREGWSGGRHVIGLANSQETIVKMHLYGYTIEPKKLYYIPLPHLETSDGIQQVLSKRENGENYFANRPSEILKQRFTKEELERVPEIYKPYAKPIEEEEE